MKKALFLVFTGVLLFSFGCATKEYVKEQVDPLADRISKLEAKIADIESQQGKMSAEVADAKMQRTLQTRLIMP